MITEMTNTTFAIWSRPLKCKTGGTTWSAALQRRRFCQAKPSLPIPLLALLLGRMYLASSSWVLKVSMDRSSADSLPVPNCKNCKNCNFFRHLSAIPLAATLRVHRSLPVIWLFFSYQAVPTSFSLSGKTCWTQNHRTQTTQDLPELLGKSNRSPSRWLHKGSSNRSLEGRIVSNLYNI